MKLTPHKTKGFDNNKISFPKLESWNPLHEVATIAVQVDKQRVLCRISKEVLILISKDNDTDPMVILSENRSLFESKARALIEGKRYEKDGSIKIRKSNL